MVEPDLLEWVGVAGVSAVIFLLGRASGRRSKGPPKIRYECSTCDHGIGYHKDQTGRCQKVSFDSQCKCTTYVGDRPPPSYEELINP